MPIFGITASSNMSIKLTDFYQIATTTVGSGGASNIEFTNIPSTYTHLQLRGITRTSRTNYSVDILCIQFNSDTATNKYATHTLAGDGGSAFSYASTTSGYIYNNQVATNLADSNIFGVTIIDILDYTNTNKYKTTRSIGGLDINGNPTAQKYGSVGLASGVWLSTNAVTSIKIFGEVGTTLQQYSSFQLYGVKA